ncbi:methyltransferase domain-containing protein, partial [Patescibacteria group bacterium]|nr:methyltransferase domain-containing protein [Patescibacteria group bacterium]
MNPASVDPTPDLESSKIRDVSFELRAAFTMHSKIVMFVNGYIEGVIRGEENIIKKAELPADITVRIIDGHVPVAERQKIQEELGRAKGKMLLVVSGQTADVGVDFSSADYVCFYNEPWTEYNKRQQTSRVYRPGLSHDLMVVTSIANGTIEEGIHEYIQLKYQAIQKVLKGIPITEIEQEILRSAENQKTQDIEGDVMLAKEWLNSPQNRLHRFFGLTKEIGEQNFHKFLLEHGDEYADCYQGIGSLGFQSNTGRVVGSLIGKMVREKGQKTEEVSILDLASGPEILKKHIPDQFKSRVISLDLNPAHFKGRAGNRIVASFSKVPLGDKSVDYANLSLALHYTRLVPSRNEYERLKVLVEMNRILKKGGTGIINLLHSLEFKNEEKLEKTLKLLGFEIVREYSGSVSAGAHYRSNALVVEKFSDAPQNIEELVEKIGKDLDGLKLKERVSQLKNARKIVDRFEINGQSVPVIFNDSDNKIFKEEQDVL